MDKYNNNNIARTEVTHLSIACRKCGDVDCFWVENADLHAWKNGTLIQDAMPYLNVDQREMLISKTCTKCWDLMCGGDA